MKYSFDWNPEAGEAICVLTHKGKRFIGQAQCHDQDKDFMSERTGCFIAEMRANIKYLQYKKNALVQEIKTLEHMAGIINNNPKCQGKSYEKILLQREIRNKNNILFAIKEELAEEQEYLKYYIDNKDKLYNRIREKENNK